MANPFSVLNQANINIQNNMNDIRSLYQMFSTSKNPMQLFSNMAMKNPNLQPILSMLQRGNNPQQIFNMLCNQKGINPNNFIKSLMGK